MRGTTTHTLPHCSANLAVSSMANQKSHPLLILYSLLELSCVSLPSNMHCEVADCLFQGEFSLCRAQEP